MYFMRRSSCCQYVDGPTRRACTNDSSSLAAACVRTRASHASIVHCVHVRSSLPPVRANLAEGYCKSAHVGAKQFVADCDDFAENFHTTLRQLH